MANPAEVRPRPRPATPSRVPADNRRTRARGFVVGNSTAPDHTNLGRNVLRALRGGLRSSVIGGILYPSELGDGTLTDEAVEAHERAYADWQAQNSSAPDVPPEPTGFRALPNGRGIEFYPSAVPDPFIPTRVPLEIPQVDLDTIPTPGESPIPLPLPPAVPGDPVVAPSAPGSPATRPPARKDQPAAVPAPGVEVQFEFRPDGKFRLRTRKLPRKWDKRQRDSKLKRWYVVALRTIDKTWGTVDEARQLAEAIVWNTYTKDGKLAMNVANRSQLQVFQGIGRGTYDVDVVGAIQDYAIAQTMDLAIGLANRHGYQGNREIGVGTGPWDTFTLRNSPETEEI